MIEIEKKYFLTKEQFDAIHSQLGNPLSKIDEENTIYTGNSIDDKKVLRIRRVTDAYGYRNDVVTYKGEATVADGLKSREELEFQTREQVMPKFLNALGYSPVLVYEKKRRNWHFPRAIVSLDELPFGYYMEIEGDVESINTWESKINEALELPLDIQHLSYPDLTKIYGKSVNGIIEARF